MPEETSPSRSTRLPSAAAATRWTAETFTGMPETSTVTLASREPSAAGADHASRWVTSTEAPTNLRAISGRRSVGTLRTVTDSNAPARSPVTVKSFNVPPTWVPRCSTKARSAKVATTSAGV